MPPLKGVIHAAGVLADNRLTELDQAAFETVMAPKVSGSWNLHKATESLSLDWFILYSSISALVGNIGQGNYAAANAYLDGLAFFRRSKGLPATSINWGAIKDVGMAAREPAVLEFMERMGINAFPVDRALAGLNRILEPDPIQVGIIDIDWSQWGQIQQSLSMSPRFHQLAATQSNGHADDEVTRLHEPELKWTDLGVKLHWRVEVTQPYVVPRLREKLAEENWQLTAADIVFDRRFFLDADLG